MVLFFLKLNLLNLYKYGVLGQVWYLIVLIPDLCILPYFYRVDVSCKMPYAIECTRKQVYKCTATQTHLNMVPRQILLGSVYIYNREIVSGELINITLGLYFYNAWL